MLNSILGNRAERSAIWRLIGPYWNSEEKWRARGLLAAVVGLALAMVYIDVMLNAWNRDFYNALESKNFTEFKAQLWRFSYIVFIYIAVSIYRIYLAQALGMRWRAWMTRQYMDAWLENQAYYRIEQTHTADNPDQRIAEDLEQLTTGSLSLSLGLLSSVITLLSFIGILWSVSGPISFMLGAQDITVSGYMVWFAVLYAIVGSAAVWWIGRPLVEQNFNQQRFEADFRFGLIRIRENAESIALYRGELKERQQLTARFAHIFTNWWSIMRTTKRLNITSTFYAQFALIFPFLVGAPRYFAGAITLGDLMQISSAFGHVQEALSWFIDAFSSLATWKASVNRLAGFHSAVEQARTQVSGITVTVKDARAIQFNDVALYLPNGQSLTSKFTAEIKKGKNILVTGPSGCGKSTLFRAVAGIWPYGIGDIHIPANTKLLFLPQKGYLPIGTLREAVTYPSVENTYADKMIHHYLDLCWLPHLKESLDMADNWSQRLSPGEQQRLAFVRAFLLQPEIIFLDEATSAVDAATEEHLYGLMFRELPQTTMISIAHRDAVAKYHHYHWQFIHESSSDGEINSDSPTMRYTIQQNRVAQS